MSRLRSSLNLKVIFALSLLILGAAWLTVAASPPSDDGTIEQQAKVRTSRDVFELPPRTSCTVVPAKELFITHVSVVDDCYRTTWSGTCPPHPAPATPGAWTLGGLLPGIFGTTDPAILSNLTLEWLREWDSVQTINGDVVRDRPLINDLIIVPWLRASGPQLDQLDMHKAPFRLLAIVSRLDLRKNAAHGGVTSAGEARFIFNVLDEEGDTTQFNVILEYGLDAADCSDVLDWANAWHSLGSLPFGKNYNAALQSVTDRFTAIGASPGKTNSSAINQVRSNEIELNLRAGLGEDSIWELREFQLPNTSASPVGLVQSTVELTPDKQRNKTAQLANFANTKAAAILNNSHSMPLSWQGQPFRGGAAQHRLNLGWDGPDHCVTIPNPDVRHLLSLNTCSGCHGLEETGTTFKHVEPRQSGSPSVLSSFLTGGMVPDRCPTGETRRFGDINRRRVDLCQLLDKTCTEIDAEPAISFVH